MQMIYAFNAQMDLETLHTFLAVTRHGSFSEAARVRGVEPYSVSRAISALETELGVRLFERTTRRMALTEAGELYRDRVSVILDELDMAGEAALALRLVPKGVLRLSTSVAYGQRRIIPVLEAFRRAYPEITLELIQTDANLDLVAERIDLAIRLAPVIDRDVICTKLHPTRYRVMVDSWSASEIGSIEPEALAEREVLRQSLLGYRSHWNFRRAEGPMTSVPVHGRLLFSSPLALREAMLAGLGPALLADWVVAEDIGFSRAVDLFPEHEVTATTFDTAAWLIYPSRAFLPAKVRVAVDFLKEHLS
ncbi:MAG: LysR substrate-binding domain-containing protein [Pseudomonadota bacterium]